MGINAVESAVTVAAGSVEGRTSVFNARDAEKRCRAQGVRATGGGARVCREIFLFI